jgi:hypothetical protein
MRFGENALAWYLTLTTKRKEGARMGHGASVGGEVRKNTAGQDLWLPSFQNREAPGDETIYWIAARPSYNQYVSLNPRRT